MEQQDISLLLSNYQDLVSQIMSTKNGFSTVNGVNYHSRLDTDTNNPQMYDIKNHNVMFEEKRPNKTVETNDGPGIVNVARLPLSFQKRIVSRAEAFLCANPIKLDAVATQQAEKDLMTLIQKVWDDNKLDYDTRTLCRLMMRDTESAEVWYVEDADSEYWNGTPNQGKTKRLRSQIIAPSLGDELFPVFDQYGDMIAFGRQYYVQVLNKSIEHFDVYTAEQVIYG